MGGRISCESPPPPPPPQSNSPIPDDSQKADPAKEVAEEEEECGFCVFMKGGGCKDVFIDWQKCLEEVEKRDGDLKTECSQKVALLFECMEVDDNYYGEAGRAIRKEEMVQRRNQRRRMPPQRIWRRRMLMRRIRRRFHGMIREGNQFGERP